MEVFPDFSSTTPEEKWKSGRWSPGKDGGEEEEKLLFFCKGFDFKHLYDDWREGPTGKKPLTSRCCPDVQKQPRSMKVKVESLFRNSS